MIRTNTFSMLASSTCACLSRVVPLTYRNTRYALRNGVRHEIAGSFCSSQFRPTTALGTLAVAPIFRPRLGPISPHPPPPHITYHSPCNLLEKKSSNRRRERVRRSACYHRAPRFVLGGLTRTCAKGRAIGFAISRSCSRDSTFAPLGEQSATSILLLITSAKERQRRVALVLSI